jgi:4-hydroxy-4-methyl-2-oxoglutarate aldolase
MHSAIRTLVPQARICGPALTVRCYPGDNLMCHYAVYKAYPGDVLMIDGGAYGECAIWGSLLSRSAAQRRLGGTVVDGAARDAEDLRQIGYPVYARALTPRGAFKTHRGEINVPISCGGVTVSPGDLIVGDEDGIVVVPRLQLATIAERAGQIVRKEADMIACIDGGGTLFEFLELKGKLGE